MVLSRHACLFVLIVGSALASTAQAQVFFEPVQSQYGSGRDAVYYGGADPRVIAAAGRGGQSLKDFSAVREGRYGVGLLHRGLIGSPPYYVVSDRIPGTNAAAYGYTPTDARDEASAAVPRYFRKAELLRAARPADDRRSWVVPAQAGPPPAARSTYVPLSARRPPRRARIPRPGPASPRARCCSSRKRCWTHRRSPVTRSRG